MEEFFDIYNRDRIKQHRQVRRGDPLPPEDLHIVIHVCIFNERGELLIQQRHKTKNSWPNLYDVSCGGAALVGETSQQAAARELYEELGIMYDFSEMRPQLTMNFTRGFDDYYIIELPVDVHTLQLQEDEVQEAHFATKEEVLQLLRTEQFVPYFESFIHLLFEAKTTYGSVKNQ